MCVCVCVCVYVCVCVRARTRVYVCVCGGGEWVGGCLCDIIIIIVVVIFYYYMCPLSAFGDRRLAIPDYSSHNFTHITFFLAIIQ